MLLYSNKSKIFFTYKTLPLTMPGLILILASLFVSSCSLNKKDVNHLFEEKYGSRIERIKLSRTQPEQLKKQVFYSQAPSDQEIRDSLNKSRYNSYRYVAVNSFNRVNENRINNMIRSKRISPRIFDITYYTQKMGPFDDSSNDQFSQIIVPNQDRHGTNSRFSDKSYSLVSSKSLQQNLDYISSKKTQKAVENSQTLIKERMDLRKKQMMLQIFNDSSM